MKGGLYGTKIRRNLKERLQENLRPIENICFCEEGRSEGFPQVAKLFSSGREAETVHAHNHLRVLNGIK